MAVESQSIPMSNETRYPWEFDPQLRDHLMYHGHHFLNLRLFQDIRDRELMMIVFDSFQEQSRLPPGWQVGFTPQRRPYYWHDSWDESETSWAHPSNQEFTKILQMKTAELEVRGLPVDKHISIQETTEKNGSNDEVDDDDDADDDDEEEEEEEEGSDDDTEHISPVSHTQEQQEKASSRSRDIPAHLKDPDLNDPNYDPRRDPFYNQPSQESVVQSHGDMNAAIESDSDEDEEDGSLSASHGLSGKGMIQPEDTVFEGGDDGDEGDEDDGVRQFSMSGFGEESGLDSDSIEEEGDKSEKGSNTRHVESPFPGSEGGGSLSDDPSIATSIDVKSFFFGGGVPASDDDDDDDDDDEDDGNSVQRGQSVHSHHSNNTTRSSTHGDGHIQVNSQRPPSAAMDDNLQPLPTSYQLEQRVKARFGGEKGSFFKGTVKVVNKDGTYGILYDDGDKEKRVSVDLMKPYVDGSVSSEDEEEEDEEEDDEEDENEVTYVGDSTFEQSNMSIAMLEEGEEEDMPSQVPFIDKRRQQARSSNIPISSKPVFAKGDFVEAKFNGQDKYYTGVIGSVNQNGTYGVIFDDGDIEEEADPAYIRKREVQNNVNIENGVVQENEATTDLSREVPKPFSDDEEDEAEEEEDKSMIEEGDNAGFSSQEKHTNKKVVEETVVEDVIEEFHEEEEDDDEFHHFGQGGEEEVVVEESIEAFHDEDDEEESMIEEDSMRKDELLSSKPKKEEGSVHIQSESRPLRREKEDEDFDDSSDDMAEYLKQSNASLVESQEHQDQGKDKSGKVEADDSNSFDNSSDEFDHIADVLQDGKDKKERSDDDSDVDVSNEVNQSKVNRSADNEDTNIEAFDSEQAGLDESVLSFDKEEDGDEEQSSIRHEVEPIRGTVSKINTRVAKGLSPRYEDDYVEDLNSMDDSVVVGTPSAAASAAARSDTIRGDEADGSDSDSEFDQIKEIGSNDTSKESTKRQNELKQSDMVNNEKNVAVISNSDYSFQVNEKVEARFGGRSKFYLGVVTSVNAQNGTYDISYDDGDDEREVDPIFIRKWKLTKPVVESQAFVAGHDKVPETAASNARSKQENIRDIGNMEMEELDVEEDDGAEVTVLNKKGDEAKEAGLSNKQQLEEVGELDSDSFSVMSGDEGVGNASRISSFDSINTQEPPQQHGVNSGRTVDSVVVSGNLLPRTTPATLNDASQIEHEKDYATTDNSTDEQPITKTSPGKFQVERNVSQSSFPTVKVSEQAKNSYHDVPYQSIKVDTNDASFQSALSVGIKKGVDEEIAKAVDKAVGAERAVMERRVLLLEEQLKRAEALHRDENATYRSEVTSLSSTVTELREQIAQTQLQGVSADVVKSLQESNQRLETRIKELNAEKTKSKEQCQESITEAERKANDNYEQLLDLRTLHQALKNAEQQLKKQFESSEKQVQDLTSSLDISNATIKQLETSNEKINNELVEMRSKQRSESLKKQEVFDKKLAEMNEEFEALLEKEKLTAQQNISEVETRHEKKVAELELDAIEGRKAVEEMKKLTIAMKASEFASKTSAHQLLEAHSLETRLRTQLSTALSEVERLSNAVTELQRDNYIEQSSSGKETAVDGVEAERGPVIVSSVRADLALARSRLEAMSHEKAELEDSLTRELNNARESARMFERQAREAESSCSRRIAEVEGRCSSLLSSNRQHEEREKYATKKLIEAEANVVRLELSLQQALNELEASVKSHRVEKRKIETEIILPLKEEVSKLTDELNISKSKIASLEQRERSSRLAIEEDKVKMESTVRSQVSNFMKEAQDLAQQEWSSKCDSIADEVQALTEAKCNGSLVQAHNLTLQLSEKAVELQRLLEEETKLRIAAEEHSEIAESTARDACDALIALRDQIKAQNASHQQEREKNEFAATFALEAATTALAECSQECRQLLLLDNGKSRSHVATVNSQHLKRKNNEENSGEVMNNEVKVEVLDEDGDTFEGSHSRLDHTQKKHNSMDQSSILGASISLTDHDQVQYVPSTGKRDASLSMTPPRKQGLSQHQPVHVKNVSQSVPVYDMAIHSMFTSPSQLRREKLGQRERKQREMSRSMHMNGRISSRTAALLSNSFSGGAFMGDQSDDNQHRYFSEEDEDDGSEYWGASFSIDMTSNRRNSFGGAGYSQFNSENIAPPPPPATSSYRKQSQRGVESKRTVLPFQRNVWYDRYS